MPYQSSQKKMVFKFSQFSVNQDRKNDFVPNLFSVFSLWIVQKIHPILSPFFSFQVLVNSLWSLNFASRFVKGLSVNNEVCEKLRAQFNTCFFCQKMVIFLSVYSGQLFSLIYMIRTKIGMNQMLALESFLSVPVNRIKLRKGFEIQCPIHP